MKRLGHLGIDWNSRASIDSLSGTPEWLSAVERLVFNHFEQVRHVCVAIRHQ